MDNKAENPIEEDKSATYYNSFPEYGDAAFSSLTLWPSLEAQAGSFYHDLMVPASTDPSTPSPLSSDRALVLADELKSLLAHIIIAKNCGSLDVGGYEQHTVMNMMEKYVQLIKEFSATLIQRLWRATKLTGGEKNEAIAHVRKLWEFRPTNAVTEEERRVRLMTARWIIQSALSEFADFTNN